MEECQESLFCGRRFCEKIPKKIIRRKLKFNEFTVDSSENDRSAISVNNDIGVFGKKGNPTFSRTILGHVHINYNFRNLTDNLYNFFSIIGHPPIAIWFERKPHGSRSGRVINPATVAVTASVNANYQYSPVSATHSNSTQRLVNILSVFLSFYNTGKITVLLSLIQIQTQVRID